MSLLRFLSIFLFLFCWSFVFLVLFQYFQKNNLFYSEISALFDCWRKIEPNIWLFNNRIHRLRGDFINVYVIFSFNDSFFFCNSDSSSNYFWFVTFSFEWYVSITPLCGLQEPSLLCDWNARSFKDVTRSLRHLTLS